MHQLFPWNQFHEFIFYKDVFPWNQFHEFFIFIFSDAELALQKAESRANHLELSLEANKTSLENNSTDQVVKEELQKVPFVHFRFNRKSAVCLQ